MTTFTRRSFLTQLSLGTVGAFLPPAFADVAQKTKALARSTPEAEGLSSVAILDFLTAMADTKHELHSFMMLRHGKVIGEGWWSPYRADLKHTMYSMSKSFTSSAIGLLVVIAASLTLVPAVLVAFHVAGAAACTACTAALWASMRERTEVEPLQS